MTVTTLGRISAIKSTSPMMSDFWSRNFVVGFRRFHGAIRARKHDFRKNHAARDLMFEAAKAISAMRSAAIRYRHRTGDGDKPRCAMAAFSTGSVVSRGVEPCQENVHLRFSFLAEGAS